VVMEARKQSSSCPPLQEVPFTCEELARLQALRQRFPLYSEYLLSQEKQRLKFVQWLVEHGKLSGDRETHLTHFANLKLTHSSSFHQVNFLTVKKVREFSKARGKEGCMVLMVRDPP
jgi:hypothetical protein